MPNRLADETSPYLLQHKENPVDWYPWGPEALAKAKAEDKPMLVSIGYSACHWCHVMEHESFEDAETAALMNQLYVNVKVDREERPDLDNLYMTAVQAMTGHGGWPLNVFVTPDGVPFYGGTYWPPEDRMGMPAFRKVLQAVHDAYANRKTEVLENAEQIRAFLGRAMGASPEPGDLSLATLERAVDGLARHFDGQAGGFGGAPKFPQASVLEFLLRYQRSHGDERVERMVRLTLDKMAGGGLYDQIGGGFHRYSVDAVWLVPHFEKMLYDNAQLARVYLDAYRLFGDDAYRVTAEETLDYVLREMTSPGGGFYATQDADSEGEEGKFYVWSAAEIDEVLGEEDGRVVRAFYGVTARGNFEGHNILNVPRPAAEVAAELGIETGALLATIARVRRRLYEARAKRVWPGRDDKVIVAWNGMMLRAFAEASRAFGRHDYRVAAERDAAFLLSELRVDGKLMRVHKDGQAKIGAFLEDYANLIDGLIALYEVTFTRRWLNEAIALAETMVHEFSAPDGPGFFDTAASAERLVSRPRDLHDGATPSGSAVAIAVLLKLARYTARPELARRVSDVLAMLAPGMSEQPIGFGRFLATAEAYLATPREIAIAGPAGDPAVEALATAVSRRFEPNAIMGLVDPSNPGSSAGLPFLAERPMRDGKVTAYVCEQYACLPPVHDPAALTRQLAEGTGVLWQEF